MITEAASQRLRRTSPGAQQGDDVESRARWRGLRARTPQRLLATGLTHHHGRLKLASTASLGPPRSSPLLPSRLLPARGGLRRGRLCTESARNAIIQPASQIAPENTNDAQRDISFFPAIQATPSIDYFAAASGDSPTDARSGKGPANRMPRRFTTSLLNRLRLIFLTRQAVLLAYKNESQRRLPTALTGGSRRTDI